MYVRDAMKGRVCKLHRLHAGPMRVYHWIQQKHWSHGIQCLAVLYLLLAFVEAPNYYELSKAFQWRSSMQQSASYSSTFACLPAGPTTEYAYAIEGGILIIFAAEELLKIYV